MNFAQMLLTPVKPLLSVIDRTYLKHIGKQRISQDDLAHSLGVSSKHAGKRLREMASRGVVSRTPDDRWAARQ